MSTVTHVIEQLSRGGGARATLYLAKYSARLGSYQHRVVSLLPPDPEAVRLADGLGIEVVYGLAPADLLSYLGSSDIVQVSWWNTVAMQRFLRGPLPPMRSIGWMHVGGRVAPQAITPKLVSFFDLSVACSPYTAGCQAFQGLSESDRRERTAMVYGATDFARLDGLQRRPHAGFNVGYIGTVHFLKMHREFVRMSAAAQMPDAKFLLFGNGGSEHIIAAEAQELGALDKFVFGGYLEDVRSALEILDVYGYPLCEATYAASEMNLQEVMYAGIPAVVFPHGGIRELVQHGTTGLVVHSPKEYTEALEELYRNAPLRHRLGAAAREYAATTFGAENAARAMNPLYEKVLLRPKRLHRWPSEGASESDIPEGAAWFLDSIGSLGSEFTESANAASPERAISADLTIMHSTETMRATGIEPYKNAFPGDPFLRYWSGLSQLGVGNGAAALQEFCESIARGFDNWRILWFLALAADSQGARDVAENARARARHYLERDSGHVEATRVVGLLEEQTGRGVGASV